jgi:hypothetical protein
MPIITNQATLRTSVADWLNRTDLSNNQLDQFIEMGEAKIYEVLRIPPLEANESFTVLAANSSLAIPSRFIEAIELKKSETGKDDSIVLSRVDEKAFSNNKIKNAYIRVGNSLIITDDNGEQNAEGTYVLRYFKADEAVGTLTGSATTTLVVGNSYVIQTMGSSTQQQWEAAGVPVGAATNVGVSFIAIATSIAGGDTVKQEINDQFILSEYEIVLFGALSVASIFLGDAETEQKYNDLLIRKIDALNMKEKNAALKGGSFSASVPYPGI